MLHPMDITDTISTTPYLLRRMYTAGAFQARSILFYVSVTTMAYVDVMRSKQEVSLVVQVN
jgi:hypothetical protein